MITLWLRFPGGRYHATPWGHHVNEGLVEWPPSPWRVLRALLATGFKAFDWPEAPETARALILALGESLPSYCLPLAVGAHTRHFMPAPQDLTLVFDAWLKVGTGKLGITWPITLPKEQRDLLEALAARMNYFGRSESWVEASVSEEPPSRPNAWPDQDAVPAPGPGHEQIPLFALIHPQEYDIWRKERVEQELPSMPEPAPGKKKPAKPSKAQLKQQKAIEDKYPEDVFACLLKETTWLRKHGWSQPPGARQVLYWRKSGMIETHAPRQPRRHKRQPCAAMLLALKTAGGNDNELPVLNRALPQGELLHRAIVSKACVGTSPASPVLFGKDEHGKPLKGHCHAHIMHLDLDGDSHIDHALIWAPDGLDDAAQSAIHKVQKTNAKGLDFPISVSVVASCDPKDLLALPQPLNERIKRIIGGRNGASVWISETPFVPPRFMKRTGRNLLEGQVQAELESRGLPQAKTALVLDARANEHARRLRHFVRARRTGPQPPADVGFVLRLEFAEPLSGPLALGYGSHFGLGLFAAEDV